MDVAELVEESAKDKSLQPIIMSAIAGALFVISIVVATNFVELRVREPLVNKASTDIVEINKNINKLAIQVSNLATVVSRNEIGNTSTHSRLEREIDRLDR